MRISPPLAALLLAIPGALVAQSDVARSTSNARLVPAPTRAGEARFAMATRARQAPLIDGSADDAVWASAPVIDGFRVFDPVEDGDPHFRTEAKIAYDEHNLYVVVHALDPRPDSIVGLLSRRDVKTASDQIKLLVDSYHDRRSGFEFAVNPVGVKRDYAIINDGEEDDSWDAVWDVATRIDATGWTAEFRIPLNQLRYPAAMTHTFGIMINRDIARNNERVAWPIFRRSLGGISSQFGEVRGLEGIASPRRLEVVPYTVVKTQNAAVDEDATRFKQRSLGTVGGDLKYGITSNLTVDATVNPDFGQVESDPSVLNLSAFETFFPEKRPFFLEGQGLFRFDVSCNDGSCSGLFYSRRIGRAPQLGDEYYSVSNPSATTILGASKLTGRLGNGMSLGVLDAVTQRESGPGNVTLEPRANYVVGRLQQDLRAGGTSIGVMATGVQRSLDPWTRDFVRSDAYSAGIDARHQFLNRRFELSGYVAQSVVRGSRKAIALTQESSVHNFQRPDDRLAFDSMRTSLGGGSAQVALSKRAGDFTRFNLNYQYLSPGFEINDVGFLRAADSHSQSLWFAFLMNKPHGVFRHGQLNVNQWMGFTAAGERTDAGGNVNAHGQLQNGMWLHAGINGNALVPIVCTVCARGGPALRTGRSTYGWLGVDGDQRGRVIPGFYAQWEGSDGGRSHFWGIDPYLELRVASRFSTSLGFSYLHRIDDAQFNGRYGEFGADSTHYTFARLDQHTTSMTTRVNFTATPTLSLQIYAQPFITKGDFSDWRELADSRSSDYDTRFRPYAGGDPGAFNFRQYRSNTVVRWEYRPGSVLYFVWTQDRTHSLDGADARVANETTRYRELFSIHPANVFLIKGSYWISM